MMDGRGRFCFAVLAFRVETLYLARRFCGLRDCNVNPESTDSSLRRCSFGPGKRGLYAVKRILNRTITLGCALNSAGLI
jgi:hypothetical protein